MLKSYPDYGKSPPEYLAGIVQTFAAFDRDIQESLADPLKGIRSVCEYLPTIAAVVKMADELVAKKADRARFEERYGFKRVVEPSPKTSYIPFPQLWAAFKDEPELLKGRSFEALQNAFMALRRSKPEAKSILINAGMNEFVAKHGS